MTLKQWFDEHTVCGFSEVASAQGHEDSVVESEYFDGSYQICKTDSGFVWLANGSESVGSEISEIAERWPQDVDEIKLRLSIDDRFTQHQRNAGRSRSPKKLAALAKNRKLAARARTVKNPSKSTLAKRASRARLTSDPS